MEIGQSISLVLVFNSVAVEDYTRIIKHHPN